MAPRGGQPRTLSELGDDQVRENGEDAVLEETAWAVGRLTDTGLQRLSTFLLDLLGRAPLDGVAWSAHRLVIEALEADARRELKRRQGDGESRA